MSVVTVATPGCESQLCDQLLALEHGSQPPDEYVLVVPGASQPDLPLPPVPFPVRVATDPGGDPAAAAWRARGRNRGAERAGRDGLVFLDVAAIPSSVLVGCASQRLAEEDVLLMGDVEDPAAGPVVPGDVPLGPTSQVFGARRNTFLTRLRGYDEELGDFGAEDADLAFVARSSGVPLQWLGAAVAHQRRERDPEPATEDVEAIVMTARRFHDKWGSWPLAAWLDRLQSRGLIDWDPSQQRIAVRTSGNE